MKIFLTIITIFWGISGSAKNNIKTGHQKAKKDAPVSFKICKKNSDCIIVSSINCLPIGPNVFGKDAISESKLQEFNLLKKMYCASYTGPKYHMSPGKDSYKAFESVCKKGICTKQNASKENTKKPIVRVSDKQRACSKNEECVLVKTINCAETKNLRKEPINKSYLDEYESKRDGYCKDYNGIKSFTDDKTPFKYRVSCYFKKCTAQKKKFDTPKQQKKYKDQYQ